jgi:hypothetical protein
VDNLQETGVVMVIVENPNITQYNTHHKPFLRLGLLHRTKVRPFLRIESHDSS